MKRDYKCSLKRFDTFLYPAGLVDEGYTKSSWISEKFEVNRVTEKNWKEKHLIDLRNYVRNDHEMKWTEI